MPGKGKPELSVTGLIAGAAATVTATVASSYFGVGGTLIGAGAVSVLSTVGATVYQHFLDRGKAQLAAKMPVRVLAGGGGADDRPGGKDPAPARTERRPRPRWYVLCGAAAGTFLAVMGLVTTFELVTGRPLSNTVQGRAGRGTSVDPVRLPASPAPRPLIHRATPAVTVTPSAGSAAARTPEATPTPTTGATATPVPETRATPTATPPGPAVNRSAVPDQAPPEDENPPG